MTITTGRQVTFNYTLTDDTGQVIDSSDGGQPFAYVHGRSEIVPGLEQQMEGLKAGDRRKLTVPPEQGYGVVNEEAIMEVPRDRLPAEGVEVGSRLQGTAANGQPVFPVVKAIGEEMVTLDFNHPLAGRTLHFDVEILTVEEAAATGGEGEADGAGASDGDENP